MNRDYLSSIVGTITPIVAVVTSLQEQIEFWLRISGLIVGLIVGLLGIWNHFRKL